MYCQLKLNKTQCTAVDQSLIAKQAEGIVKTDTAKQTLTIQASSDRNSRTVEKSPSRWGRQSAQQHSMKQSLRLKAQRWQGSKVTSLLFPIFSSKNAFQQLFPIFSSKNAFQQKSYLFTRKSFHKKILPFHKKILQKSYENHQLFNPFPFPAYEFLRKSPKNSFKSFSYLFLRIPTRKSPKIAKKNVSNPLETYKVNQLFCLFLSFPTKIAKQIGKKASKFHKIL